MKYIASNQEIFLTLIIFAFSGNLFSVQSSTTGSTHVKSLLDQVESDTTNPVKNTITRKKRWTTRDPYFGTHWCKNPTIIDNNTELGIFFNTDKCCKNHAQCTKQKFDDLMKSFDSSCINTDINLCYCEEIFRKCLQNSWFSNAIGEAYFYLGRKCITKFGINKSCKQRTLINGVNKCSECDFSMLNYYTRSIPAYPKRSYYFRF